MQPFSVASALPTEQPASKAIGGARYDSLPLDRTGGPGRGLGDHAEWHGLLRRTLDSNRALREFEVVGRGLEQLRGRREHLLAYLPRRDGGSPADDVRRAASLWPRVIARGIGVGRGDDDVFDADAELCRDDLGNAGHRAGAALAAGRVEHDAAVVVELQHHGGGHRVRQPAHRGDALAAQPPPVRRRSRAPGGEPLDVLEAFDERHVVEHLPGRGHVAVDVDVSQPQLAPIHADRSCEMIDVALEREDQIRAADAAVGPGGRRVRVVGAGVDAECADPVVRGDGERADGDEERRLARVRARVHQHHAFASDDLPVAGDRGTNAHDGVLARCAGAELVLARVDDLDRAAGLAREQRGKRFEVEVDLAAESAPDRGDHDPHLRLLHAAEERSYVARPVSTLGRRVDDAASALPMGGGGPRLDVCLVLARHLVLVLDDDDVLAGERGVDVAALDRSLPEQVVGTGARHDRCVRLPLRVDEGGVGLGGRAQRGDGGQRSDLELDRPQRVGGQRLRVGRDRRDGLAREAHDAVGEERLVHDDPARPAGCVGCRHDRVHPGHRLGLRDVEPDDAAGRRRRAEDLPVKHPRLLVIDPEDRLACDLCDAVDPPYRATDHALPSLASARAASTMAR